VQGTPAVLTKLRRPGTPSAPPSPLVTMAEMEWNAAAEGEPVN
jgi:hypothetical protein